MEQLELCHIRDCGFSDYEELVGGGWQGRVMSHVFRAKALSALLLLAGLYLLGQVPCLYCLSPGLTP